MTFRTWTETNKVIHLDLYDPPIVTNKSRSVFVHESITWAVKNLSASKETMVASSGSGTYDYLLFSATIKRTAYNMLISVLVPVFVVNFLGNFYYLIEIGTDQRTPFLGAILLSEIFFLNLLSSLYPFSSVIPYIEWLFLFNTIILTAMTLSVLILEYMFKAN